MTQSLESLALYVRLHQRGHDTAQARCARHIWDFVAAHPQPDVLWWYPDHGPRHLHRVATLCGELLQHVELSDDECFCVLAACLLHDIGMSDAGICGVAPEGLDANGYSRIRDLHSESSANAILDAWREQPSQSRLVVPRECFPDHNYARLVAELVKAHRTSGFKRLLEVDITIEPSGQPCRTTLLAAALLMGDEMDLHNDRAAAEIQRYWKPITRLHHRRHHYVDSSHFTLSADGSMEMQLLLGFPSLGHRWAAHVCEWTGRKLAAQARHVKDALGRHGVVITDSPRIRAVADDSGCKQSMLDDEAGVLFRDLMAGVIPNYVPQLETAESFVRDSIHFEFVCGWGTLRQDVLHFLEAISSSFGLQFLVVKLSSSDGEAKLSGSTTTPDEMIETLLSLVNDAGVRMPDGSLIGSLEEAFASARCVVCVVGLDEAERSTTTWVTSSLLPLASKHKTTVISLSQAASDVPLERLSTEPLDDAVWLDFAEDGGICGTTYSQAVAAWESVPGYSHDARMVALRAVGLLNAGTLVPNGGAERD